MATQILQTLLNWLQRHTVMFSFQQDGADFALIEKSSGKVLRFALTSLAQVEERQNKINPEETYLLLLFDSGIQLVLCRQGFAFAPNFANSGPISLPNQVYCLQDFLHLFDKLRHLASEESRNSEALQLILALIAILDGAKAVGLDVAEEEASVDRILIRLEKGLTTPLPEDNGSN